MIFNSFRRDCIHNEEMKTWLSESDGSCQDSSSAGSAAWLWCCAVSVSRVFSDAVERLTCLKLRSRSSVLCLSWLNLDSRCSSSSSSSCRHRWFMRSTCDSSSALHCCLDSYLQQSLLGNAVRTALPLLQLLCVVDDADFLRTRTKRDVRTVNLRQITGALCGRCWSSQCCQNKVLLLTYRANQNNDWPMPIIQKCQISAKQ